MAQSTSHIFMVRPAGFGFNEETSASNAFQQRQEMKETQAKALAEFDGAVDTLRAAGVDVRVFEDSPSPIKPDAIFPNNWISLHDDGTLVLYPMHAPNRRPERRQDIMDALSKDFEVKRILDWSAEEQNNRFLEGTGSVVFDHINRVAFACLSPRTDKYLFAKLCAELGYEAISFYAYDENSKEIYHTNVMMSIGDDFAVICPESIANRDDRNKVMSYLRLINREIIELSFSQLRQFAGNVLELKSTGNEDLLVLSEQALRSLNNYQKDLIAERNRFIPLHIPTIETIGGGSARCMIAELFAPLVKG